LTITTSAAALGIPFKRLAGLLPDKVLNEDEQLQRIYDTAVTQSGGE
jgi:hypothetical protein